MATRVNSFDPESLECNKFMDIRMEKFCLRWNCVNVNHRALHNVKISRNSIRKDKLLVRYRGTFFSVRTNHYTCIMFTCCVYVHGCVFINTWMWLLRGYILLLLRAAFFSPSLRQSRPRSARRWPLAVCRLPFARLGAFLAWAQRVLFHANRRPP